MSSAYYFARTSSSRSSSSSSSRSSSKTPTSKPKPSPAPSPSKTPSAKPAPAPSPSSKTVAPATPKTSTKPSSTTKTTTTKPNTGTVASKNYSNTGYIIGNGYTPRFTGYTPPAGSTVYYRDHSFVDYLPWIYIFSQANSPQYSTAAVVQPDGKQVEAKPAQGVDGLFILNWIVLVMLAIAIIAGLTYLVYRFTNRTPKEATV